MAASLLTLLHLATGVTALLRKPTWLVWAWRALSVGSALTFLGVGWSMAAAAIYVGKLYLRLGPSVAGGIWAAAILLGLLTLPIAIWGALHTWPSRTRSLRRLGLGGSALGAVCVLTLPLASSAARAEPVHHVDAALSTDLGKLTPSKSRRGHGAAWQAPGLQSATPRSRPSA